ncbi:hypothetical protein [Pseudemcibacter aquimaris]|uniref:hypothetical protein n=1 Tax=Pseudemcibacter aquimaris TaxID=2857064 RepID=UPI0020114A57|nr:hypothetical protein [Pseudemcibacter aquimaris]MCC3861945.1 hypothetical protein [Pseudemcibacter aquimaris]WDU58697.1 hypothetical protein KW060_00225 [Pseudemcibacter aquimaris]
MILKRKKSVREIMVPFFNGKLALVSLMVATFMVFASGSGNIIESGQFMTILIGAALFSLASGLLIWAGEVSRKLYQ